MNLTLNLQELIAGIESDRIYRRWTQTLCTTSFLIHSAPICIHYENYDAIPTELLSVSRDADVDDAELESEFWTLSTFQTILS